MIFKTENVADLSGRHDAEGLLRQLSSMALPAMMSAAEITAWMVTPSSRAAALECSGLFWRKNNSFHMRQGDAEQRRMAGRARWRCAVALRREFRERALVAEPRGPVR
ncbi:hypothetical protein RBB78_08085 [Tunturiibacter empetritectus]|uniref:hypothetical protein n=1 Tax=Tunturiibacter empetritectus TaxID=3069691 RepID=UPI003D9BA203